MVHQPVRGVVWKVLGRWDLAIGALWVLNLVMCPSSHRYLEVTNGCAAAVDVRADSKTVLKNLVPGETRRSGESVYVGGSIGLEAVAGRDGRVLDTIVLMGYGHLGPNAGRRYTSGFAENVEFRDEGRAQLWGFLIGIFGRE